MCAFLWMVLMVSYQFGLSSSCSPVNVTQVSVFLSVWIDTFNLFRKMGKCLKCSKHFLCGLAFTVISRDTVCLFSSYSFSNVSFWSALTSTWPRKSDLMELHPVMFRVLPFPRLCVVFVWACVFVRVCCLNMLFNNQLYVVSCPVQCRCH